MSNVANTAKTESATPTTEKPGLFSRMGSSVTNSERAFSDSHPIMATAVGVGLFTGGAAIAVPAGKRAISAAKDLFGRGSKKAAEEVTKDAAAEQASNFLGGGVTVFGLLGRK